MKSLAEDRNLIVHRSSIIDSIYKKARATRQSIDDKLIVDGEGQSRQANLGSVSNVQNIPVDD